MTVDAEYEELLKSVPSFYDFPDLDENSKATTFYTTGTTGNPKGVYFTHRQLVLHTLSVALVCGTYHTLGRFRSDDVYMPMTPMFRVESHTGVCQNFHGGIMNLTKLLLCEC